jgi:hypothetical protein
LSDVLFINVLFIIEAPKPSKMPGKSWTKEEVSWITEGVATYGEGCWRDIQQNFPFADRSNVDIKDKYRNMQKKPTFRKVSKQQQQPAHVNAAPVKAKTVVAAKSPAKGKGKGKGKAKAKEVADEENDEKQRRSQRNQQPAKKQQQLQQQQQDSDEDDSDEEAPAPFVRGRKRSAPAAMSAEVSQPLAKLREANAALQARLRSSRGSDPIDAVLGSEVPKRSANSSRAAQQAQQGGGGGGGRKRPVRDSLDVRVRPRLGKDPEKLTFAPLSRDMDEPVAAAPAGRGPKKRRQWAPEEEEWLLEGVEKFGIGAWSAILGEYAFSSRTAVNLKDKWRNLELKASASASDEH